MERYRQFFISHSSATKELARHFFYLAISNGVPIWYDEHLLNHGDDIKEELRKGIEASDVFLLLYSKPAINSQWVAYEMEIARKKADSDPSFRCIAIKLDKEPLPESWEPFLYSSWNPQDESASVLSLLSDMTGKSPIINLSAMALLTKNPSEALNNNLGTIAEHTRNYVLYYLAHIKYTLTAISETGHTNELRDSLSKILQLSLFKEMPIARGGVFLIEPGVYEMLYANRKVKPPKITLRNLPDRYSYSVLSNNEISCKVAIIDNKTNEIVRDPVPISFQAEFDARL